jgi:drug/metabolite transporter (DMT)-like permease
MSHTLQSASALYALGAFGTWGVSDFVGGYTARRFQPFLLAALGHLSGTIMVASLALATHETLPPISHLRWACLAGAAGGMALGLFYRALSQGNMGIAAPVAAVLSASIPAVFGAFYDGFPAPKAIVGFVLAIAGIWLVSRPENGGRPRGLGLAVVSGLGFALFFILMRQAGSGSALWMAAVSRSASLLCTSIIVLCGKKFSPTYPAGFLLGLIAGCVDVSGTALFVRASQTGRLDAAVVLSSLYPAITVLLARVVLKEQFTRWKTIGILATLASVPLIASA